MTALPNLGLLLLLLSTPLAVHATYCNAGWQWVINGCQACPAGQYQPAYGYAPSCKKCPAGQFARYTGSSSCQPCGPGGFSAAGASQCTPCTPGYFQDASGQTSCKPCDPGYYQCFPQQSKCTICPSGQTSGPAAAQCTTSCAAGTYLDVTQSKCQDCPAGTYNPTSGGVGIAACKPCGPGTSSNAVRATSSSTCVPCAPGFVSSGGQGGTCQQCPPGTFQSGPSTCQNCDPGTANSLAGQTSVAACKSCGSNFFSGSGASTCNQCPPSSFCGPKSPQCQCPSDKPLFCTKQCCPANNKCRADGYCEYPCANVAPSNRATGTCTNTGTAINVAAFGMSFSCVLPTTPAPALKCTSGQAYTLFPASPDCTCQQQFQEVQCTGNKNFNLCLGGGGTINGDPHFTGYDGSKFDFHGAHGLVFNLITEQNFLLNGLFGTVGNISGTEADIWLMGFGIRYKNTTLVVQVDLDDEFVPEVWRDAEATHKTKMRMRIPKDRQWLRMELNGNDVSHALYSGAFTQEVNGTVVFFPQENVKHPGDKYDGPVAIMRTPDFETTVYVETEDTIHLDLGSAILSKGMERVHGVLGQTYHWQRSNTNKVEGDDMDYMVRDGLLGTGFKHNLFQHGMGVNNADEGDARGRRLEAPVSAVGARASTGSVDKYFNMDVEVDMEKYYSVDNY